MRTKRKRSRLLSANKRSFLPFLSAARTPPRTEGASTHRKAVIRKRGGVKGITELCALHNDFI